ncbi:hypothetical protein [Collimonas fungivorans]|uniref:Uncharacterized protein n=1 Tax=Collimonas fungivorans (strain Ter331) TaxID=1005048 RepID=G0A8I1_COLFT|nr:hypothetical protein [Collimonas fungivorans]AEK61454.1 hypothetical protein CFU_1622 [Collimonas fungivorans Ter331]
MKPASGNRTVRVLQQWLFAVFLMLAGASSFAAGKTSGLIELPIAARPDIPTAITWSAELLNAADTALAAKNPPAAAVPNGLNWVRTNFSRHHIIPQQYLQALVAITQAPDSDIADADVGKVALRKALGKIRYPSAAPLLTGVVWAPVNLFEGPVGFLRSDEPGNDFELNKPRSFDEKRWDALRNVVHVMTVLEFSNEGSKFTVSAQTLNARGGLARLTEAVVALAKYTDDNRVAIHRFSNTDWIDGRSLAAINLQDLVGYSSSLIVTDSLVASKKNAYRLKLKADR